MGKNLVTPYPVRMPDELRAELERVAKENGRSLNAEILLRLQSTLDQPAEPQPDLADRVATLEQQVADMRAELDELRRR